MTAARKRKPPSPFKLEALFDRCDRMIPRRGSNKAFETQQRRGSNKAFETQQRRARKVSVIFARELRRRGWLVEEGYAPGSWAAR